MKKEQSGFTLIELMSVVALLAILLTLGAGALRRFWFVQSLSGAQNEVMSQLRVQQQESRTSAPKVFGASFRVGSSEWDLISYDESRPPGLQCSRIEQRTFSAGVVVESVDFATDHLDGLSPCLQGDTDLVLFYARGSATPGQVTVHHPVVDRSLSVCVTGITGRVERC